MYLSQVILNPTSKAVRADVLNPEGMHKTLMRAFADGVGASARRELCVLYRLDRAAGERITLLMQSQEVPRFERWPAGYVLEADRNGEPVRTNPATRSLVSARAALRVGTRLAFRLRANTTKKVDTKSGPNGERRNGRRVPVAGDEARRLWLERRARSAGFEVDMENLRVSELGELGGRGGKRVTVGGADFDGTLVVRDVETFREALKAGIGPAKAYGFGLLSIAPVR